MAWLATVPCGIKSAADFCRSDGTFSPVVKKKAGYGSRYAESEWSSQQAKECK